MKRTVYIGEKPVYISNVLSSELSTLTQEENTLLIKDLKSLENNELIQNFENSKYQKAVIINENFEDAWNAFTQNFILIEAAGGVVQNSEKELLFIFRRGKWDLPKGKMEAGEDAETCANREIEEETGTSNLRLIEKITDTYHVYQEGEKKVLKISHWYYFTSDTKQELIPQTEEDITLIEWIAKENLIKPLNNTFHNIKDVIEIFLQNH